MIFEERMLGGALSAVARRVWYLETRPLGPFEKILPLPYAHLIVNLSQPYRLFDRDGMATEVADAFVSGLQSAYLVIESPPRIRHVGLELTPLGLDAVAAGAGVRAAGHVADARTLLPDVDALIHRLQSARDIDDALDAMMGVAISAGPVDPLVSAGLTLIESAPETSVTAVASAIGSSATPFIARFRAVTGRTPKQHAQVLRFHRLVDAAHAARGMPVWADLAAAAGYYDQPHVIRAFRRFSGWTPTEYYRLVAEHGPIAAHFVPLDQVPKAATDRTQARS